jgi:hypothetical protein
MDGTVIAFTRRDIRLITGDGPNEQGIGGFPSPRIYTSGIGCSNYRSIVETPAGVFFQYGLAIYLIPRGFGPVVNVSANVHIQLQAYPAILSAAYLDGGFIFPSTYTTGPGRQNLVRFLVSTSLTTASTKALTLDLTNMQWLADSKSGYFEIGVWSIRPLTVVGDAASPEVFTFALAKQLNRTTNPTPVEYEADNAFEGDPPAGYITQLIQTAWISPFGLAGWGRIRKAILMFERDPFFGFGNLANLTFTLYVEDTGTTQTKTWAVNQSLALAGVSYREIQVSTDVCTSIAFRIEDGYNASDGKFRGFKFIAILLEVEPLPDLRPQNSASEKD